MGEDNQSCAKNDPLRDIALGRAIVLRWALRDIKGNRLTITPVNPVDLQELMDLGLVEMRNEKPVITDAGYHALG